MRYKHHGFSLEIPLSHELPYYRRRHPQYGSAIGVMARATIDVYPAGTIVDIGANVGDTAATIRAMTSAPILCIEGDDAYARLLRRNAAGMGDVEVVQAVLDEATTKSPGNLVRSRGTARWAGGRDSPMVDVVSLSDLLESHPRFRAPKLVKLDTDGMDSRILRGAASVIRRSHPVLFLEYDPYLADRAGADLLKLMSWLVQLGYREGLAYRNTGEFLTHLTLGDSAAMGAFHREMTGHQGRVYADVCIFHGDDAPLGQRLYAEEARSAAT